MHTSKVFNFFNHKLCCRGILLQLTTSFQHLEEEIIREQSGTETLDACKLSRVIDLADVLSDINPLKELGYDDIYQFYKNHFVPSKNDQLSYTLVTKNILHTNYISN